MTVIIVALSAFGLAAVVGLVLLAVKLSTAKDAAIAARDAVLTANRAQVEAEKLRDEAVAARDQADKERDIATAALAAAQQVTVEVAKENADHVHDVIANADLADAGRLFDEQLQAGPNPDVAGEPAAGGAGHAGAPAVPPARAP